MPGVTAMLAVAARIGAPLGHDFCAISLSDNLKPWDLIERRLDAASQAGFVIALYNPISKARPWQLGRAFECLRANLPASTPVIFGRAAGRPDERIESVPLGDADPARADMATCVIIGSAETRIIERGDKIAAGLHAALLRRRQPMSGQQQCLRDAFDGLDAVALGRRTSTTSMPRSRAAAILA